MFPINSVSLLIILLFSYFSIVFILHKKNILKKYNISFYGPALLLRTNRGVLWLKKIADRKRFWKAFGSFGILFCFIMMLFMILLLLFQTWTVIGFTPEQIESLPGIEFGLVIPGLNPILPLEYIFYVVFALIIAVIVHEFSHGILSFVSGLKVKSLGILYMIIPLGAFCEPDEENMKKTEISKRMRIYSAGPTSNFTVVLISLILFSFIFMSAVQPIEGAHIFYVIEDSPADKINISTGSVITEINDFKITNLSDFYTIMNDKRAGDVVNIAYFNNGYEYNSNITLDDRFIYTKNESHINQSFLGVGFNPYSGYISILKNPFRNDFPNGLILLYALPFFGYMAGYNPIASPFTDSLLINGPLSIIPSNVFWIIVNTLYWIFWLNLAVGLFNVLPIIPLDGGFLFSDGVKTIIEKTKKNISEAKKEKLARNISAFVSLLILFIVLFPWIIKYI
jgi:membrane-associated protease RseP (regulator of RpoE activity)